MTTLFTDGLTVTLTPSEFSSYATIQVSLIDATSPVDLVFASEGTVNFTASLTTRSASILGSVGNDGITTGFGNDTVSGDLGDDTLNGGGGSDSLYGGDGADILNGDAGVDLLDGGLGDDTFVADGENTVADTFRGGDGIDTLFVTSAQKVDFSHLVLDATASVEVLDFDNTVVLGTNDNDTINVSGVTTYLNGGVFSLDSGNDSFTGSVLNDSVIGFTGNDTLRGGDGVDSLYGGAGNDSLDGGAGDDLFSIDLIASGNDTFRGGDGIDTVSIDVAVLSINRLVLDTAAAVEVLAFNGNTLQGTTGADTIDFSGVTTYLSGSAFDLRDGNDAFTGSVLVDVAYGGIGNDTLRGGDGADTLTGGAGDDSVDGGAGDDLFIYDQTLVGNDTYLGGSGSDVLILQSGDVSTAHLVLDVAASVEVLDFNLHTVNGTAGSDTINISGVTSFLNGGVFALGDGNDSFVGSSLSDVAQGGAGNDTLAGGTAADSLTGDAGDDSIDGGTGDDTMVGGDGNDTFVVNSGTDTIVETATGGRDTVRTTLTSLTLATDLENLTALSSGNSALTGNSVGNILTGNTGNDTLDGAGGNDTMAGGLGNDTYLVGSALDVVTESTGAGIDTVRTTTLGLTLASNVDNLTALSAGAFNGIGNTLANVLTGNVGNDTLDGGSGNDTLKGGAGNDTYIVDSASDVVTESAGAGSDSVRSKSAVYALGLNVENLVGLSIENSTLTGNNLANHITGNTGNDLLDGLTGSDTMTGGLGNDRYVVDGLGDVVVEQPNQGIDTVSTRIVSYVLAAGVENLIGTSTTGQHLTGNLLGNSITGAAGNDTISGGAGPDTMKGGSGNDIYVLDAAGDVVTEAASGGTDTVQITLASYTLAINVENLVATSAAALNGKGNVLGNHLTGNAGNDVLNGMTGHDTLTGAGGADVFVFNTALSTANVDMITDFNAATDTFHLENNGADLFNAIAAGPLAATAFKIIGPGGAVVDANDRILYKQSTGQLFYDADGSGAGAMVQFATLSNLAVISATDFLIV